MGLAVGLTGHAWTTLQAWATLQSAFAISQTEVSLQPPVPLELATMTQINFQTLSACFAPFLTWKFMLKAEALPAQTQVHVLDLGVPAVRLAHVHRT
jgi:hypothetical protein